MPKLTPGGIALGAVRGGVNVTADIMRVARFESATVGAQKTSRTSIPDWVQTGLVIGPSRR